MLNFVVIMWVSKYALNYTSIQVCSKLCEAVFTSGRLPFTPHHPITPIQASSPCLNPFTTISNLKLCSTLSYLLHHFHWYGKAPDACGCSLTGSLHTWYVNITKLSMMTFWMPNQAEGKRKCPMRSLRSTKRVQWWGHGISLYHMHCILCNLCLFDKIQHLQF